MGRRLDADLARLYTPLAPHTKYRSLFHELHVKEGRHLAFADYVILMLEVVTFLNTDPTQILASIFSKPSEAPWYIFKI